MAGYQIKEIYLGIKEHTSFEDYREDVGKLDMGNVGIEAA